MTKHFFEAIATLVGCVIGAGILGMPYVIAQSGFLIGLIDIILIGAAIMITNLLLGEVVLRTKGNHQLTGYAEKYLGKKGKWIITASMVFGIYGALLAYLIGEGETISAIFGTNPLFMSLIFFAIMALLIFFGLKAIERSELLMSSLKILIFVGICTVIIFSNQFSYSNLSYVNPSSFFIPYGVILFAFIGMAAIPEMKEEMTRSRHSLKKAIIIGSLLVLTIYIIFSLAVIGVTGTSTTEVATIGLGAMLGRNAVILANLFAVLAMATSFLALGLALKEMYQYDFKINKQFAWALTCVVPLVAYLLLRDMTNFIGVIGPVGAIAGGIDGIIIILMHRKAVKLGNKKPEYTIKANKILSTLLILLFGFGIVYAFLRMLGII